MATVYVWLDQSDDDDLYHDWQLESVELESVNGYVNAIARRVKALSPIQRSRVVHVQDLKQMQLRPEEYTYIGRDYGPWIDEGWGNPFKLKDFQGDRRACLRAYTAWLVQSFDHMRQLEDLTDRHLVCHCRKRGSAGQDELCHGLVLVALSEWFKG